MVRVSRRLAVVRASAVLASLAVVAALALPGASAAVSLRAASGQSAPTGDTSCVTTGLSTTCTGTYSGNTAWDPTGLVHKGQNIGTSGAPNPVPPQVTVSQTSSLVNQDVQVSWKNFTPSTLQSQWPPPNGALGQGGYYGVSVYECAGTNPLTVDYLNGGDCYDPNQLQANQGTSNRVQDTYTLNNGSGEVNFYVEAGSETNSFLNCDPSNPCSLAIVPNWGGEPTDCSNHAEDFQDANIAPFLGFASPDFDAIYGHSPCSWPNRIIVPLTFGPTATNCPQVSPEFYSEGSPMLERAMNQWIPGWCSGSSPLSLSYAFRTTEEQARSAFLQPAGFGTASIDVALTTLPPDAAATAGSTRKFTYAPLAVSAVAIGYYIDDPQTHTLITHLLLDARLVAKLLTESYALDYGCTTQPLPPWPALNSPSNTCDPAVIKNYSTIFDDPEFLALNTHCEPLLEPANYTCTRSDFPQDGNATTALGQFLPTVLAGNSDMTYELTRWIGSNPDAIDFIDGRVDPNGMHVNTNYLDQAYPISQFATLDDGTTFPYGSVSSTCSVTFTCVQGTWNATMQGAWNPVSGLDNVAADLASYQPQAENPNMACPATEPNCQAVNELTLGKEPQQGLGARALFSVVDEGDAGIFQFPTAYLVNAAGNAAAPTTASMQADVQSMDTNPDGITQYSNFAATDPAAYPVTLVDYAMVATCGLSSAKASAIADFLTKVATSGQTPGLTPGTLSPGYVPLDAKQRAQTLAAASAVQSQDCRSAAPDNTVSGEAGVNGASPNGKSPAKAATKATPSPSSSPLASAHTAAYGIKSPLSGLSGVLIVLAMIFGGLLVAGGPVVWMLIVTGKWPVVVRWLRTALSRLRLMPGQLAGLARRV